MMKICAHSLIKNEERYIWYAVMSVIDYVDKMFIYDTGSNDLTATIVKEIQESFPNKIEFEEVGAVTPEGYTELSQKLLNKTKSDWILLVDGDEVWWEDSIKNIAGLINERGSKFDAIVQPYYNVIGDIFHYQEKEAGMYQIDKTRGHLTIRAINRKISGLHFEKEHGQRGIFDGKGKLIQDRDKRKRLFTNSYYLHFTNMIRSSSRENDLKVPKRSFKFKYELGKAFPKDFYYPEVFFMEKPSIVKSVWEKRKVKYQVFAALETPLKKIKRRVVKRTTSGY